LLFGCSTRISQSLSTLVEHQWFHSHL
jgi:hypothetical protein